MGYHNIKSYKKVKTPKKKEEKPKIQRASTTKNVAFFKAKHSTQLKNKLIELGEYE